MTFRDRDLGFRAVMKALRESFSGRKEPGVVVGFRSNAGRDLLTYAAANEFGTDTIPERSFLRSTADEHQEEYLDALEDATGVYIDKGPEAGRRALGLLGLRAVRDVQRKIVDLKDPPNAPSTIEQKGSSNPLIDTGRMRQSIDFALIEEAPEEGSV